MGRDVVAGYRFFDCEDCGKKWKERSRDAQSPSGSTCPNEECEGRNHGGAPGPVGWELHPEWKLDSWGTPIMPEGMKYHDEEDWDGKFGDE